MREEKWFQIGECLGGLPVLEQQAVRLQSRTEDTKLRMEQIQEFYRMNGGDMKTLNKESFSSAFSRLLRRFGKKAKGWETLLSIKLEYEKEKEHLQELVKEKAWIDERIEILRSNKLESETQLKAEMREMSKRGDQSLYEKYSGIQEETIRLASQIVATHQAAYEAKQAQKAAKAALKALESAEDLHFRFRIGGKTSEDPGVSRRMSRIQSIFNHLYARMKDLERELEQVHLKEHLPLLSLTSSNNMVSFWFSRVFSDKKSEKIFMENTVQLHVLLRQLEEVIRVLEKNEKEHKRDLLRLEKKREKLLGEQLSSDIGM